MKIILILMIIYSPFVNADKIEHILWERKPIKIQLPIDEERMVIFPEPIILESIGEGISDETLKVINNQGVLYFRAKNNFPTERFLARLKKTQKVILLDIEAKEISDNTTLKILLVDENKIEQNYDLALPKKNNLSYIELTRFAIKKLYSPHRLQKNNDATSRVSMKIKHSIDLIPGDFILTKPVASWSNGKYYVTAVELKNKLSTQYKINTHKIKGNWKSVTAYPREILQKSGNMDDSTTIFLVSTMPFVKSMRHSDVI